MIKKLVTVLGMGAGLYVLSMGVVDFDKAQSGVAIFKALFWMIVGAGSFWAFVSDYRSNRWPWGF
jgi:hypothetical protein